MPAPVYPLSLPTSPGFRSIDFRLRRNIGVLQSPYTGHQQTQQWPFVKWAAVVTLPAMTKEQAGLWSTFFAQVQGRHGTFLLGNPGMRSTLARDATVRRAASAGDFDLSVQFPAGTRGQALAGEFVSINSGAAAQLYQITTTVDLDSAARATIGIEPALKVDVTGATHVEFTNPRGVFRMLTNDLGWTATHATRSGFSFACEGVD